MLLVFLLIACTSGKDTIALDSTVTENPDATATDSATACDSAGDTPVIQPEEDFLEDYPPVVIRTVPEAGDNAVDPALSEIRITFSKDMMDRAWSWVQISARLYPETTGDVYYADKRTNVLPVSLEPDHDYVVWLNYEPEYMGFTGENRLSAVPYMLSFHTAGE